MFCVRLPELDPVLKKHTRRAAGINHAVRERPAEVCAGLEENLFSASKGGENRVSQLESFYLWQFL